MNERDRKGGNGITEEAIARWRDEIWYEFETVCREMKKPKSSYQKVPARGSRRTIKMAKGDVSPLVIGDHRPDWRAHYAWSAARGGPGLAVRYFRLVFNVPADVAEFCIHVTADSRYRLWLNGAALGFGPAKGSLARYYFETYELAPLLRSGTNILVAEVRHFGEHSPVSEVHSPVPGWLVQGPAGAGVDTPGNWRVWSSDAVTPDTTPRIDNAHIFLHHLDFLDTRREPVDWRGEGFDDSSWETAASTGPAAAIGAIWGVVPVRRLVPRDVAALHEETQRFRRSIRSHQEILHRFGPTPTRWEIPAGEGGTLLLDAGEYVTAFPEFQFGGGAGREMRITYAEALGEWIETNGGWEWCKRGRRDDLAKDPHGYRDTVLLRGGEYDWEPFYWRAFRFIALEVLPGDQPLTVRDARFRVCVHPQRFQARFAASDAQAQQIFAVSVRTMRVGAHEIYDDSPYFEQISYIADSRMEALGSLHLCNETGLPRRNLRLFLDTLRPDGLLDARVPCQYARQTIPYFCLHWIFMVEDYWRWVGAADQVFVRECLVAVDTILGFFRARLRDDGFVGVTGGWNMVDRVEGWLNGEPPAIVSGGSTYLSCLLVEALGVAARLHVAAGEAGDAVRWQRLGNTLRRQIRSKAWDEKRGLFREGSTGASGRYSHHVQAGAINAGVADAAQTRRIARKLWNDPALIRTHSMQSYYVARALERAGAFGGWHEHLMRPWRESLANGLTTWPEYPDPCRSDSHAWAAWPAVDYVTAVLGVQSRSPGWNGVRLAPQTDGLGWAKGQAPSPAGMIQVAWQKTEGRLQFDAQVPAGLAAEVFLPGAALRRFPAGGTIELSVPLPPS